MNGRRPSSDGRLEQVRASQVRVPDQILVAGRLVRALARADLAGHQPLGVRRPVVQVRGTNLDVPADRVDHQRQDPGVIDQVQERLVMRQRVAERERVVRADAPGLPRDGGDLVDGSQQPAQLILG